MEKPMTKEELQAKVNEAKTAAMAQVTAKVEEGKLKAQLNLFTSEAYIQSQAQVTRLSAIADKLKETEAVCKQIVAEMPIYSDKTRENRKFQPTKVYGYGNQIAALTGVLNGIRYSSPSHKEQMLAYTNLSEDLIDTFMDAFGQTSYYSKNYATLVEETPADINQILSLLPVIEATLEIEIDKHMITEANVTKQFELSRIKAERSQTEDQIALDLGLNTVEA